MLKRNSYFLSRVSIREFNVWTILDSIAHREILESSKYPRNLSNVLNFHTSNEKSRIDTNVQPLYDRTHTLYVKSKKYNIISLL